MMKIKVEILSMLFVWAIGYSIEANAQLGLNYAFSHSNLTYQSIAHSPGVVQILDTTNCNLNYIVSPQYPNPTTDQLINFGTVPFDFYCNGELVGAIYIDIFSGKITFNNHISLNLNFGSNAGTLGPLIIGNVLNGWSGYCLGNSSSPLHPAGVEVGNFACSTQKFTGSNGVSTVTSINSNSVCFANQATSASPTGNNIGIKFFTGRIYYNTIGQAPNRRFIIEYKNYHRLGQLANTEATIAGEGAGIGYVGSLLNFQFILHEGTNDIAIHFGVFNNPGDPSIGLLNEDDNCDVNGPNEITQGVWDTTPEWCGGLGNISTSSSNANDLVNTLLVWSPIDLIDNDGDGFTSSSGDCNENNPAISPNATEICDNIDNNCNTQIDEGFDQDGDGVTTCAGDCNDLNPSVYVGAVDINDGIDNNCDGIIDENFDADGDGVTPDDGDCNDANSDIGPTQLEVCNSIDDNCNEQIDEGFDLDNDGYTTCGGDCNDANNLINPSVLDLADGIDNDCDESIDENFDADNDGVTPADGDCNDANPSIGPNQIEYCNGIDDNCNNLIDENFDSDNDGFTLCNGDCNDYNATIYPGAIELDDNIDNNCDGSIDEIFDGDGDGVSPADGDCNDSNPNIGPSALEICNNVDDNCNGLIDEDLDCSTENTDMFVPTGFSPNNDGFNDSWQIPWLVNQSGYSVMVVNRWEQRVFFTNNFGNGWDGTYEGEKLPTADYYYVITLSDGTVLSGALTIKY